MAIEKIDTDKDSVISKPELIAATDQMIARLCSEILDNDREGWIVRMDRSSEGDFFSLLDEDRDG